MSHEDLFARHEEPFSLRKERHRAFFGSDRRLSKLKKNNADGLTQLGLKFGFVFFKPT